MPYCPKCDMEFVDGITTCTDCGGPLAESKEAAEALKKEELEKRKALKAISQASAESIQESAPKFEPAKVYVNKAEKYDDLKSSASAFLIVGGVLLAFSLLCWINIIHLPMAGTSKFIFQGALTLMGIFSLVIFLSTSKSAKLLAPEIEAEKHQTEDIIAWFMSTYSSQAIDATIQEFEELTEEEQSLKRFQIIQDYLITGKDLPDPSYVDALSEEIYSKLYESTATK